MANREEIKLAIAYMAMAFPNYHPDLDGVGGVNAVDVLADQVGDLPSDLLWASVRACCTQSGRKFAPSGGELRGMAADLQARIAGLPTAAEAWGAIMQAFRQTSFDRPALLDHPLVAEAVRCMGGLTVLGASENNVADRAHFLKIYDGLREKAMRDVAEHPQITAYVENRKQIASGVKALTDKLAVKPLENKLPFPVQATQRPVFLAPESTDETPAFASPDSGAILAEERAAALETDERTMP